MLLLGGGGGGIIGVSDEDSHWILVNIDTVGVSFFLGHINDQEVSFIDVGDYYLHRLTKDNIYTVEGTESCKWKDRILICVRSIYDINT